MISTRIWSAAVVSTLFLVGCNCRSESGFNPIDPHQGLENDHGSWLSMDLAPDGRLAVAFYDRTRGAVGFAVGDEVAEGRIAWRYEEVDGYPDKEGLNPGDRGKYASMKVTPDGAVWVAYHDSANGALRAAKRTGATWESELADAGSGLAPSAGHWASLDLDADGNPVVAHHEAGQKVLRVARHDGTAWSADTVWEGTDWTGPDETGEVVTRPADVGQFARLLIHDGTEYIAFYDAARQSLDLLEGTAGAYTHTVVHDGVDVGQWPSIWTDGTDLAIAFHDVADQDLLLATRSGGGAFSVEVVDDGEFVGADTEVFKKDGDYAILYFDGRYNDMKLATRSEGSWTRETLGGETTAVGFHNEVVETGDGWWVASYDYTHRDIYVREL